jgi:hypothetical protein
LSLFAREQLRVVAHRRRAGDLNDDQQRLGVIALRPDELVSRASERGRSGEVGVSGRRFPFGHLRSELGVDLRAQARARDPVHGKKARADPHCCRHGDRDRELRPQAAGD